MPWVKPTADEDLVGDLEESITDHYGVRVTFFQPTNHFISAKLTFSCEEGAEWSSSKKGDEWIEKVNQLTDSRLDEAEKPKDTSDVYPRIQYTDSTDGPTLLEQDSLLDLINTAQKPLWDTFLKEVMRK